MKKVKANPGEKTRIVVIGGGTGMPVLLRGLKELPIDLTALVTVADDGGSTGRLRNEMDIPAPGDIRNVIAAMSDVEPMLIELFQHRFNSKNGLSGHSMGNLLLAAMTSITGDFYTGIEEISRVLNVKGHIYPISNDNLSLHAEMVDGEIVSGESKIPQANKQIQRVFLKPEPVHAFPNAVESIYNADLVVISPGSLYTSILPSLITPHIEDRKSTRLNSSHVSLHDALPISLHAEMVDGEIVSGESKIPQANKQIQRVFLKPEPVHAFPNAVESIYNADLVVISPGSLYTSILPSLITPHI